MNGKLLIAFLATASLAAGGGWLAATHFGGVHPVREAVTGQHTERKVLYYQSSMHPWVKSDKPGKCTVCGMDLVPVYEGQKGYALATGTVSLGSNAIQAIHLQVTEARRLPLNRTLRVAGTIDDNGPPSTFSLLNSSGFAA